MGAWKKKKKKKKRRRRRKKRRMRMRRSGDITNIGVVRISRKRDI